MIPKEQKRSREDESGREPHQKKGNQPGGGTRTARRGKQPGTRGFLSSLKDRCGRAGKQSYALDQRMSPQHYLDVFPELGGIGVSPVKRRKVGGTLWKQQGEKEENRKRQKKRAYFQR